MPVQDCVCVCVCVCVCAVVMGRRWVGGGVAENWCYQYLTNPSSIFMADNRADLQLSREWKYIYYRVK